MWILLASPTQRTHHDTFWILCRKLFLMNVSKTVYGIVLVLLWLQIKNYKNAWFSSATQRRIQNPVKHLRWSILWKRLLVVNCFCKRLYFRYLRGFWIRLCHLWHKFSKKWATWKGNTYQINVWKFSLRDYSHENCAFTELKNFFACS